MPTNLSDTNCFGITFWGVVNFSEVYISFSVVGWIIKGTARFYRGTKELKTPDNMLQGQYCTVHHMGIASKRLKNRIE